MDCLNQIYTIAHAAEWQSGHAADCKSVYAGSIPTSASMEKSFIINSIELTIQKSYEKCCS